MHIKLYFDGHCPESLLNGKRVEMRLNEDDFWESEATGLQIAVFPPYAAVLRWRGKGNFRKSSDVASNVLGDLVMTATKKEEGKEIMPDEDKLIHNEKEFESYLGKIYNTREEFDEARLKARTEQLEKEKQEQS
jgi:hypothetical protein